MRKPGGTSWLYRTLSGDPNAGMVASCRPRPAIDCPSVEWLVEFELGMLPPSDLSAVGDHIFSCKACESALESLQLSIVSDPVVQRIKRCMESPYPAVEPACLDMAAAVRAMKFIDEAALRIGSTIARAPRPGDSIGPYELCETIGRGGMGIVYRARHTRLNRQVALKMILEGIHAGRPVIDRFLREGKAIARLRHPNVVEVYDLGECDGLPFLSMELVDGGSLRARLARGPLGLRDVAELVRSLALAIAYAHQEKVVHRDLNPANILLTVDGTPKIADFGLAKLLSDDQDGEASGALTETGAILGTANYMAPEQAEGRIAAVGPSADVYALGAILYEALAGRPPFVAETKLKTLELVCSARPLPPSRRRPGVPFRLESICLKCLEKSPAKRYSSARALAEDLDHWLQGNRPLGMPSIPRRLLRFTRRNVAALLIGLVAIGTWTALYIRDPARPLRQIQADLALGRKVTLIGERGKPTYSRWLVGESRSQANGDNEGFALNSWTLCLLELLPNPQSTNYRLAARVSHRKSDTLGEVGIFFGHQSHSEALSQFHSFGQLSFNTVRGDADIRGRFSDFESFRNRPPKPNMVSLRAHLYSDEAVHPYLDLRTPSAPGPLFMPEGEDNARWHDLELIVTSEMVTAKWDGQAISITASAFKKSVEDSLKLSEQELGNWLAPGVVPSYTPHGGIGLYVLRGSASFHNVTITPLDRVPGQTHGRISP